MAVNLPGNPYPSKLIPLNGKLVTSMDGTMIGPTNFKQLINLAYTDHNTRAVAGMEKINTTPLATYLKARNAFHFRKSQPVENHLIAEVWNASLSGSVLIENTTTIPNQGDFNTTPLLTSTSTRIGRFSVAPDEAVVYCNGVDNYLWGGNEAPCKGFIIFDPAGSFWYDYTDQVTNTINDADNRAIMHKTDNGVDPYTKGLWHLNNTYLDVSGNGHTWSHTDVLFDASIKVFGTHSLSFPGTSVAWLEMAANTDWNLSGGVWTIDTWIRMDDLTNAVYTIHYQETIISEIPFSTGIAEPVVGETVNGQTSTATGVVAKVELTSGSWAGGNAAGILYLHTITGTWQNAENIRTGSDIKAVTTSTLSATGTNYTQFYVTNTGAIHLVINECYATPTNLDLATAAGVVVVNTWYHLEFTENGNSFYIFAGQAGGTANVVATTTSAARPTNHAGVIYMGRNAAGAQPFRGWMDELRAPSLVARHTAAFTVPTAAYGSTRSAVAYIRSSRALQGVKFYVATPNTVAATCSGYGWAGTGFVGLTTLVDGTATAGVTLAKTGIVSFDSTVGDVALRVLDGSVSYVYQFIFEGIDDGVEIYYCTLDAPVQPIVDIWDGQDRQITAFYKYSGSPLAYNDFLLNVRENSYNSADTASFVELDSLTTSQALFVGLSEQAMAIVVNLIGGHVNTTASTVITVSRSRDGISWESVGNVVDGTSKNGISFAQSGTISWNAPLRTAEFKSQVSRAVPFYHYKLTFSQTLSADVQVFYVGGIPASLPLGKYAFPINAQGKLLLCCDVTGKKHSFIHSQPNSNCIFNGTDLIEVEIGESGELVGGLPLYSQYGSSNYNMIILFKQSDWWKITGTYPAWEPFQVSAEVGLKAPLTLKAFDLPGEVPTGLNRRVFAWQGDKGVYISDGRPEIPIHWDIRNYFDTRRPECINASLSHLSTADIDIANSCYIWRFASGTDATELNKELQFDFKRWKWFEVDRTSGKRVQISCEVQDQYGGHYNYGFIDTGYMERLDHGTTWDGTDMTFTMELADGIWVDGEGAFTTIVKPDFLNLLVVADLNTLEKITYTHYVDTAYVGTVHDNIDPFERDASFWGSAGQWESGRGWGKAQPRSRRVANISLPLRNEPRGIFHSGKFEFTTNNETVGFEPLALTYYYTPAWQKLTT